jgi:hypothetical protein
MHMLVVVLVLDDDYYGLRRRGKKRKNSPFPSLSLYVPSPKGVSLLITILTLYCFYTTLVFSIYDSTEEAIQKMIEAIQRMITIGNQGEESVTQMNPAIRRHF